MAAITAAASSVHMMTVDGERGMREAGGRRPHGRGVRKSESVSHDSFPVHCTQASGSLVWPDPTVGSGPCKTRLWVWGSCKCWGLGTSLC